MQVRHSETCDALIVGAGPVGLLLACELRRAGVSVLVLEQAEHPLSPLKSLPFGLRGLSAPTLDALYRRGLLEALAAAQPPRAAAHLTGQARRPAGHFAGIQFFEDKVDTARWRYRPPGPALTGMAVTMQSLETVLAARAQALGVEFRRGVRVDRLDASDEDVAAFAGDEVFRSRWLVGCDGGRSAVRRAAGFAFAGTEPEFTGYSVDVELADPDQLRVGRSYTSTGMYSFTPPGTLAMVDFDGGAFHRSQPIALNHVQAVLRRLSETSVTVTALRSAATWTDRAFQAAAYRRGRVLLAGDAAHITPPSAARA